jgi:hypothetical protein
MGEMAASHRTSSATSGAISVRIASHLATRRVTKPNPSSNSSLWPSSKAPLPQAGGIRTLPTGIQATGTGFYIEGNNHSDDLFMFLKRQLSQAEGVQPNTTYRLKLRITFASKAPGGCIGIGGSPGEGVTLKAGASNIEPKAVLKDTTYR